MKIRLPCFFDAMCGQGWKTLDGWKTLENCAKAASKALLASIIPVIRKCLYNYAKRCLKCFKIHITIVPRISL